jgi:hypothetical protein
MGSAAKSEAENNKVRTAGPILLRSIIILIPLIYRNKLSPAQGAAIEVSIVEVNSNPDFWMTMPVSQCPLGVWIQPDILTMRNQ